MSYSHLRDVVEKVRDHHRRLGVRYARASTRARHERSRLLLEEMQEQEHGLGQRIQAYLEDDQLEALDTWVQFTAEGDLVQTLQALDLDPEMSAEDVLEQALKVDERVRDLHERLMTSSDAPRVRELFEALIELGNAKQLRRSWDVLDAQ